jgi:hypothetical protein
MINEEVILKSIDDAIGKCKPKYFSRNTINIFNTFYEKTKNLDYENALCIDSDGNILWKSKKKDGDSKKVKMDREFIEELINNGTVGAGSIDSVHNHPLIHGMEELPCYLSNTDLLLMMKNTLNNDLLFRSETAIGADGSRMSIILKNDAKKTMDAINDYDDIDRFEGFLKATTHYQETLRSYLDDYTDKLSQYSNLTIEELYDIYKGADNWGDKEIRMKVHNRIVSEIGGFEDYLKRDKVIKEFDDLGYIFKFN